MPAASAFFSSPPDTTSAPAPSCASVFSTARLPLALTEKAISASFGQRGGEDAIMPLQRGARIAIERRADFVRPAPSRSHVLGMKHCRPGMEKWFIARSTDGRLGGIVLRPWAWSCRLGVVQIALHAAARDGEQTMAERQRPVHNRILISVFPARMQICSRTRAGAVPPRLMRDATDASRRQHTVDIRGDGGLDLLHFGKRQLVERRRFNSSARLTMEPAM